MTSKKFDGHKQAAAKINYYDDGSMELVSYTTVVITVDKDGWMHVNGLYTKTTIKHIGWFAKIVGTTYQTCKQLLTDCVEMNIHTGEIRDWE